MPQNDTNLIAEATHTSASLLLKHVRVASNLSRKIEVMNKVYSQLNEQLTKLNAGQNERTQKIQGLHGNQLAIFNSSKTLNGRWNKLEKTHQDFSKKTLVSLRTMLDQDVEPVITVEKLEKSDLTVSQRQDDLNKQFTNLEDTVKSILDKSQSNLALKASSSMFAKTQTLRQNIDATYKTANSRLDDLDRLCSALDTAIAKYQSLLASLKSKIASMTEYAIALDNRASALMPNLLLASDQDILSEFEASGSFDSSNKEMQMDTATDSEPKVAVQTSEPVKQSSDVKHDSLDKTVEKSDNNTQDVKQAAKPEDTDSETKQSRSQAKQAKEEPKKKKKHFLFW